MKALPKEVRDTKTVKETAFFRLDAIKPSYDEGFPNETRPGFKKIENNESAPKPEEL